MMFVLCLPNMGTGTWEANVRAEHGQRTLGARNGNVCQRARTGIDPGQET